MEKNGPTSLSELCSVTLSEIGDHLSCQTHWEYVGLCFEIRREQLVAKVPPNASASDQRLCQMLMEHLSARHIPIEGFLHALEKKSLLALKKIVVELIAKDSEARQQMDKYRTTQYLAFPANTILIDPTEKLKEIYNLPKKSNDFIVITGLSGLGKTTLATEYGRRYGHEYDLVIWIECTTEDHVVRSFVSLAHMLGIKVPEDDLLTTPTLKDLSAKIYIRQIKAQLQYKKSLIVYDDCNWETILYIRKNLHPPDFKGRTIVTTQRPSDQWNTSLIPAVVCEMTQYNKEAAIDYMLKVVYPNSTPSKAEVHYAEKIYDTIKGAPVFISLIAISTFQNKISLQDYWKLHEQRMDFPDLQEQVPLLMIFEGLDSKSKFVMHVLAIAYSVDASTFYKMAYLIPDKDKRTVTQFKRTYANLIDMSLIKVDHQRIIIGHDIIQNYFLGNTMTPQVLNDLVDICFQHRFPNWLLKSLLLLYIRKTEDKGKVMNKLIEVAILWTEVKLIEALAFEIKDLQTQFSSHWQLLDLSLKKWTTSINSMDFRNDKNSLTDTLAILQIQKQCHGANLAWRFLLAFHDETTAKTKHLHALIKYEYGQWLVRHRSYTEALEQYKMCLNYRTEKLPEFEQDLHQTHLELVRTHLEINPSHAFTTALDFLVYLLTNTTEPDRFCHLASILLVQSCEMLKQMCPALLHTPKSDVIRRNGQSDEEIWKQIQHERNEVLKQTCTTEDPTKFKVTTKLRDNLYQLTSRSHAIMLWRPMYSEAYYIAYYSAIENTFPLISLRLETLFIIAEKIMKCWDHNKWKELGDKLPDPNMEPPELIFPPPIPPIAGTLKEIFMLILKMAIIDRCTIQEFLDFLKDMKIDGDALKGIETRLYETLLPKEYFVKYATRLKHKYVAKIMAEQERHPK